MSIIVPDAQPVEADDVGKIRPTRQGLVIDPSMRFGAKSLASETVSNAQAQDFVEDE